jgi:gamma-glutamyl hercynylcysteine S-oxide synthase
MPYPCPHHLRTSIILILSLLNFSFGYCGGEVSLTGGGAVGICYLFLMTSQIHHSAKQKLKNMNTPAVTQIEMPVVQTPIVRPVSDDPIEKMVLQSRYALLLRNQVAGKLTKKQFLLAINAFQNGMALVVKGDVRVDGSPRFGIDEINEAEAEAEAECLPTGSLHHVEPFFLDRYPVTNRQYYEFVAGGGYREMALWDKKVWPAVLDLVDQTGMPGPRFWRDGCYLPNEEDLPVVGICWHEAAACACWMCKRLPTDAEWVKAASWPVPLDAQSLVYRRYPWGDAMDLSRANVWGSGPNRIVDVRQFSEGSSISGIYQLIGNVWEWTNGDFHGQPGDGKLELPTPMKTIRGGAFDTYFTSQTHAQFQSGESPLSRRHNIGFRCAIGMSEIVLSWPGSNSQAACEDAIVVDNDEIAEDQKETIS